MLQCRKSIDMLHCSMHIPRICRKPLTWGANPGEDQWCCQTHRDFTKMMSDMMGAFPMDMTAMNERSRRPCLGEKMSKVALDAAEKSTDLSAKWTKDTIAKMADVTTARRADRLHQGDDRFRIGSGRKWPPSNGRLAEIAKKVQMETSS